MEAASLARTTGHDERVDRIIVPKALLTQYVGVRDYIILVEFAMVQLSEATVLLFPLNYSP